MNPVLNLCSFSVVPPWRMHLHLPLQRLVAVRHAVAAPDVARMIGRLRCHGLAYELRRGASPLEARNKDETARCPSRWEKELGSLAGVPREGQQDSQNSDGHPYSLSEMSS